MENLNSIYEKLGGLGVAFYERTKNKNVDPEKTIICALSFFDEDRKILNLVSTLIQELHSFIHVERLKALSKGLKPIDQARLGALSEYHGQYDSRFRTFSKFLFENKSEENFFGISKVDQLRIEREKYKNSNYHPVGINFGVSFLQDDLKPNPKKFLNSKNILKNNIWFRMRLLFGTNWRADVATVMLQGLASSSYQAQKILGCSNETSYRNWNALREANLMEVVKI
jgi:hypothetical protein